MGSRADGFWMLTAKLVTVLYIRTYVATAPDDATSFTRNLLVGQTAISTPMG